MKTPLVIAAAAAFTALATPTMAATCNGTSASETITCTSSADTGDAAGGNDTVNALGGNDVFVGNTGDDSLNGGNDDDDLSGDAGNDIVRGEAGDDIVRGGGNDDEMRGGDGSDVFHDCCGTNVVYAEDGSPDGAADWFVFSYSDNGTRDVTTTIDDYDPSSDGIDVSMGTEDSAELAAGFDSDDDGIIEHQEGNSDLYAENVSGDLVLHFGEGGFGNTFSGSDRLILKGYGSTGVNIANFETYVP